MAPGRFPGRVAPGWLLLLAAWLALSAVPAAAAPHAGETVTRVQYLQRVEAAAQTLAAAEDAATGRAVAQVAADLERITTVALPSGRKVAVEPLLSGAEQPAIALARLRVTAQQLAAAEDDQVAERLAVLDRVLAGRELQPQETILDRLLRWLEGAGRQAEAPAAEATRQVAGGLNWAIGIAGALIALVLISFLIQGLVRGFVLDVDARRRATGADEAVTAASARQQATELARVGNYRAAVRRLYLATLLSLEEHGLLRYDRSLTNREMLARLGQADPIGAGLAPVVDTFEQVWYGIREPDQRTFDAYRSAVDATGEAILAATHEPRRGVAEVADGSA